MGALLVSALAMPARAKPRVERVQDEMFARRILANKDLDDVAGRARELLKTGLNAGSTYPEIWIRDFATFMEVSCQVNDHSSIRKSLLLLLRFQRADGDIPDGLSQRQPPADAAPATEARTAPAPQLKTTILSWREVIENPNVPDYQAFKNSVETDQETSLVQAIHTYIEQTGDTSILSEVVEGRTVSQHLEAALNFVMEHRFSKKYGLIYGATTIDWGDIAPEDNPGAVINDKSHLAVDIYDNAMFLLALQDFEAMSKNAQTRAKWRRVERDIRTNARKNLWDAEHQKFIPHLYLSASPFPKDFDENAIWYHGGTAVAIQAGLLTRPEIAASLQSMRLNVKEAGGLTVGITNYPVYPKGFFVNGNVDPWVYQNGGDWDWFGARMVQALVAQDFGPDAYLELLPIVQRVQRHNGFYEWFDRKDQPQGSATFRGSAGVIGKAITMLRSWAQNQVAPVPKH